MNRRLTIQPEAVQEANEAYDWYEEQQPGLGDEFYRELVRCLERILENPLLYSAVYRGLRKRRLDRFPYLVFYRAKKQEVSVVSVFHGSHDPAVWKSHVE